MMFSMFLMFAFCYANYAEGEILPPPPIMHTRNYHTDLHKMTILLKEERAARIRLESLVLHLQSKIETISATNPKTLDTFTKKLTDRVRSLESNMQMNTLRYGAFYRRVVLTVQPNRTSAMQGDIIPFRNIITASGIKDMSSVLMNGTFTCERKGYYLLSFFFVTTNNKADMLLTVNGLTIGNRTNEYVGHTNVVAVHLDVGDRVYIAAGDTVYSWMTINSTLSIIEIN